MNSVVSSLTTQRSALSYNMARSVQVASERMIKDRQYVDLNDHCMGKMAVLYPIEKAYEAFMEYVDLLNDAIRTQALLQPHEADLRCLPAQP